jgi:hypothetical protein
MQTKKYAVRTALFALKDPQLSASVLALFSGAGLRKPAPARQVVLQKKPRGQ